ncbi:helix-turn-helix domain-containing protein [Actinomadura spongiicola]|uniref:Helix-turn-helix domain-containing protein n=1 Tax=Actinomadura spongiicola TaxID=2303421 RepID=A0A372GJE2_9ACTN|nr:helix-turn-helix domain-containing protein [Actinomadura spongiicola]RFS85249.1 helix-turn-helix domain-containing protein [Actinomadura spongiicola]
MKATGSVRPSYREYPAPGLACSWTATLPRDAEPFTQRVVPDGCVDLMWSASGILVAGPDTGPIPAVMEPGDAVTAVRFAPGTAPPVLGVPADAIRDGRLPLRDLWGGEADRLAETVGAARDPRAALVAAVRERMRPPDPLVPAVVSGLEDRSVRDVADGLGISERQLRRRSLAAFGYGPKTLQRVLRFQRALRLARAGEPLAGAAFAAGYADQAHFAHEVRALAGEPARNLL